MRQRRIFRSTSLQQKISLFVLVVWLCSLTASAQNNAPAVAVDTVSVEVGDTVSVKVTKKQKKEKKSFIRGIAVGIDLIGLGMEAFGSEWALMEVMARLNLKEKIYPIVELGLGEADHEGRDLDNRFNVHAPYFRVGADYNFNKNQRGNRLFAGFRYGFSAFNYDLTSPVPLEDPVFQASQPFEYKGMRGNAHWAEIVFGLETRLWKFIRMGWDVRGKFRMAQKTGEVGPPWLIPGFGKNDTSGWGGSFKVIVEL